MTDPNLIVIVCRSKSGSIVEFAVKEVISIDGRPLQPDPNDTISDILTRLAALEAAHTED
jgi:hypothetical protein